MEILLRVLFSVRPGLNCPAPGLSITGVVSGNVPKVIVTQWARRLQRHADIDAGHIGLWGHSMGGGVSTRVLTLSQDVKAAVLYGAMSGDEQKNYERIYRVFSNGARGLEEVNTPVEAFANISPIFFLDRITATISIHHGQADEVVPPEWSLDLCDRLTALGKSVECFTYPGQPHTFVGEGDTLFMKQVIEFFDRELR